LQLGRYGEAVDEMNRWKARGEQPELWAWEEAVYWRSGCAAEARAGPWRESRRLPVRGQIDTRWYWWPIWAHTGKDRVLEVLRRVYAEHSPVVAEIKANPIYNPVRSDPQFQELLRRIRLNR
jgi:hypothetical protein